MSTSFPHDLPRPPDIDHAAAMRTARSETLKQRLNWAVIADEFLGQLKARLPCRHHPLAELVADLKDAPLEDAFELDTWIQSVSTREKARLGEAVLRLLGEAQLHVLSQLDERPFSAREGTTMATKKTQKPQRETIACCRPCQRPHIMTGTAAPLKRERALRCPHCKQPLAVVMAVERVEPGGGASGPARLDATLPTRVSALLGRAPRARVQKKGAGADHTEEKTEVWQRFASKWATSHCNLAVSTTYGW
jgi:hypothetical protein